jgi:imidazolonepropionase-like amidohydrolase
MTDDQRSRRVVLAGGLVFDGRGTDPAPADVAISDGRIVDVGPDLDGDERVELAGRTLLPGFFDCHTHVVLSHVDHWRLVQQPFSYQFYEAARNLEATLRAGITTARDAGGADLGIKRALADGLIAGPRLHISVRMISQTGGHGDEWFASGAEVSLFVTHPGRPDTIVDGPDEMRRMVRTLVRYGADVIKVATSGGVLSPRDKPTHAHFRPDELEMLVAEATAAGIPVMAHAQAAEGIKNAVRAGIRSIEHGIYLDDEAISLMLERGTWLVPTLVAPVGVVEAAEAGAQIPEDSRWTSITWRALASEPTSSSSTATRTSSTGSTRASRRSTRTASASSAERPGGVAPGRHRAALARRESAWGTRHHHYR